jgi:hypothetical protein
LTYYGAVVTADAKKTIYALDCASGSNNSTQCFAAPMTVTAGPSLFARVDSTGDIPVTVSCDIEAKTKGAVCEEKSTKGNGGVAGATGTISAFSAGATNSANRTVDVVTLSFNGSQIHYNELIITKGASFLSATSSMATKTPVAPSGK